MNVEVLARLGLSLVRGLGSRNELKVPGFPEWRQRAEAGCQSGRLAA